MGFVDSENFFPQWFGLLCWLRADTLAGLQKGRLGRLCDYGRLGGYGGGAAHENAPGVQNEPGYHRDCGAGGGSQALAETYHDG